MSDIEKWRETISLMLGEMVALSNTENAEELDDICCVIEAQLENVTSLRPDAEDTR